MKTEDRGPVENDIDFANILKAPRLFCRRRVSDRLSDLAAPDGLGWAGPLKKTWKAAGCLQTETSFWFLVAVSAMGTIGGRINSLHGGFNVSPF